jgi:hypothetical protein
MKLSSLSDENSTHQNKAQNQTITKYTITANSDKNIKKPKPQKESIERNRKKNMGTHLTVRGVCTTVRPEKSGT